MIFCKVFYLTIIIKL